MEILSLELLEVTIERLFKKNYHLGSRNVGKGDAESIN